jgi:hypothetical protein
MESTVTQKVLELIPDVWTFPHAKEAEGIGQTNLVQKQNISRSSELNGSLYLL